MKKLYLVWILLAVLLMACSKGDSGKDGNGSAAAQKATGKSASLDLSNIDAICKRILPNISALPVEQYTQVETEHKKTYGTRARCTWKGKNVNQPWDPKTFIEFEVECTKDKRSACEQKKNEVAMRRGEVFEDSIDGVACHSLHEGAGSNFVYLENGCFAIVYSAQPPMSAMKDKEMRAAARKEAKLALTRKISSAMQGS